MEKKIITSLATSNIALIKYWGKRDEKLILPQNSSLSITLGEELGTKTSVMFTGKKEPDKFYINGEEQDLTNKDIKERFEIIEIMRKLARVDSGVIVASQNSFPTAAGLASSASGISALVFAVNYALNLDLSASQLAIIARQGSGSACRSLAGGFVKWERGFKEDGSDSVIRQIAPADHWPELVDIIAIASTTKKKVSSRAGMKETVATSRLYKARLDYAEKASEEMEKAILAKDFERMAMQTMVDSNNMHAVMLDTYPPVRYLNDVSNSVISAITELNASEGKNIAAYTFDAGPNANIITLEEYKPKVLACLEGIEGIQKTITTKVGSGPEIVDDVVNPELFDGV